jgi:hypothetical protein
MHRLVRIPRMAVDISTRHAFSPLDRRYGFDGSS